MEKIIKLVSNNMNKKKKILIIAVSVLALTIVTSYAGLQYYWNTNPETLCNKAGGFWAGVRGCSNYCNKEGKYCPDKLIFGCSCGLNKCWDGKKCVAR